MSQLTQRPVTRSASTRFVAHPAHVTFAHSPIATAAALWPSPMSADRSRTLRGVGALIIGARSRTFTTGCSIRIIGAVLAVVAGLTFATSAVLQKAEALRVPASSGSGLLGTLARRPRWVGATL